MVPAAIYARKSMEDPDHSADIMTQVLELRTWAARNGYEVVVEYLDNAKRGNDTHRPELARMMSDVHKGRKCPFAAVLIVEWDRLYRDIAAGIAAVEEIESFGIDIIATRGGGKPAKTRDERMGRTLNLVIAHLGGEIRTGHTFGGQVRWAAEGYSVGGIPPYGYTRHVYLESNGARRVRYRIDEEKAAVVRRIYDWYSQGLTLLEIPKILNEQGVPTSRGAKWKSNKAWLILFSPGRQETYLGAMVYNRARNHARYKRMTPKPREDWIICPGAHEPILTPEVVAAVNAARMERHEHHETKR
jgi:DNA invertase Pin-like site-specific DNA recombinase